MGIRLFIFLLFAFFPNPASFADSYGNEEPGKKVALVIGNGNYNLGMLSNPENDAKLISGVLMKLEFKVYSYSNLDWKSMKKAIDDFSLALKGSEVGLFFYAGHGVQSGGINFLVPVDANPQSESQVEYDCIPADRIMALMEESGVKIKIMILDACRNNPFEKRWSTGSPGKGLAIMKASSKTNNTYIAYSTSPGNTAADGSGANSPYTSALGDAMLIPDLKISDMFTIVARNVAQKTNYEQNPWKSDSMIEDFYFNPQNVGSMESSGIDYFSDSRDKSNYQILNTGNQVWTLKSVNYTTFNNGDTILEVSNSSELDTITEPASYLKSKSPPSASGNTRLYNYLTVNDVRNICPAGWHVPGREEWLQLAEEIGVSLKSEDKLKPGTRTVDPKSRTAEGGVFSVLPASIRDNVIKFFSQVPEEGFFSSEGYVVYPVNGPDLIKTDSLPALTSGHSIRCIRGRNPLVSTDSVSRMLSRTAALHGRVNPNMAYTFASFEYGTSTTYGFTAEVKQVSVTGSQPENVYAEIANLLPGTTYHFRLKAENNAGTSYGADQTFTTLLPPELVQGSATSVSASGAQLNGLVKANDSKTIVSFEYGTGTEYGNSVSANEGPLEGRENRPVSCRIGGLKENTLYHYRLRAESRAGVTLGDDQVFTTLKMPVVKADSTSSIGSSSAIIRGFVNTSGLLTDVIIQYGNAQEYSDSLAVKNNPVNASRDLQVSCMLKDLKPGEKYFYRIKASNIAGTSYSGDMSFETPETATDKRGNIYSTVKIGRQTWMAENLRTTKFNDGTDIPLITSERAWSRQKKPAFSWFNNDSLSGTSTGALYNWYTANSYKLCPAGWHVPDDQEWDSLLLFLGGTENAGIMLKEQGDAHWQKPNDGATNESGFTAIPGGIRDIVGSFTYYGTKGQWWTTRDTTKELAWYRSLDYNSSSMTRHFSGKNEGYSIRCLKDPVIIEKKVNTDTVRIEDSVVMTDPRDGQKYMIAHIGPMVWMAENLKATKLNDGTEIPEVVDKIAWSREAAPVYCWYDNHEAYKAYGALYNWHAVNSGKLCPIGWHVPSYEEWGSLLKIFGGEGFAGGYLKESGTAHWEKPNTGYNSYNPFNGLPGGFRDELGNFAEIGQSGYWWGYLKSQKPAGWYHMMSYSNTYVTAKSFRDKPIGLSVRCVKDN